MNFKEAKDKLKKLADGSFHSISYEIIEYSNGDIDSKCELYTDSVNKIFSGRTWEIAFNKLEYYLGIIKTKIDDIEEFDNE